MKRIACVIFLMMLGINSFAAPVFLDFSSDTYNKDNRIYKEDGFSVTADYGFHSVRLDTLAWYETSNTITISKDNGLFDLKRLTVVNTAYMGLTFESSKGGKVSIGGIKGVLDFSGAEWSGIKSFTINTILNDYDILNQIDNIRLDDSPAIVPEPSSLLAFLTALFLLLYMHNKRLQSKSQKTRP